MSSLRVAVVQYSPEFGAKEQNLRRIDSITSSIDADVIVLPELCNTGYFFLDRKEVASEAETGDGRTAQLMRSIAQRRNAIVVAGFAEQAGTSLFNSTLVIVPEDSQNYVYRKIHLFYREQNCFDIGDSGFFVVRDERRDLRLGPMICYDWRFPESARALTLLGADLIACPSNLVTDAWHKVMPARAIENKIYLAVANRAGSEHRAGEELRFKGQSAIYAYNGEALATAAPDKDEVLYADIQPAQTRDKSFNAFNDVLSDRRPEYYVRLCTVDSK